MPQLSYACLRRTKIRRQEPINDNITKSTSPQVAADKVFRIPELLEQILHEVRICDLFSAASVCRTWKVTFENSASLQKKAQLVPQGPEDTSWDWFEDELDDASGIQVETWCPTLVEHGIVHFRIRLLFESLKHESVKATRNQRKCLATQPPCTTMRAIPFCYHEAEQELINPKGVTVGNIVDAARRIFAEHWHCSNLISRMRESMKLGFGFPYYPVFYGEVQLPEGHPSRVAKAKDEAQVKGEADRRELELEQEGWGNIWYEYRRARRTAAANGEDLPT